MSCLPTHAHKLDRISVGVREGRCGERSAGQRHDDTTVRYGMRRSRHVSRSQKCSTRKNWLLKLNNGHVYGIYQKSHVVTSFCNRKHSKRSLRIILKNGTIWETKTKKRKVSIFYQIFINIKILLIYYIYTGCIYMLYPLPIRIFFVKYQNTELIRFCQGNAPTSQTK